MLGRPPFFIQKEYALNNKAMQKNRVLLTAFLAIVFVFAFAFVFAKSEETNGSSDDNYPSSSPSPSSSAIISASPSRSSSPNTSASPSNSASPSPSSGHKNNGQVEAQEHRSVVANFVQALLRAADREDEIEHENEIEKNKIGEQVRIVAQQQNQAEATTTEAITKIQNRSKIKIFLIGSDYKNLGALRSETVQTRNRIKQLTNLLDKVKNASSTAEITSQIQTLEQEQTKIDNFIKAQEGKFSLFGWLVKLFSK